MNKVFLTWMAMFAAISVVDAQQISAVAPNNTADRQQYQCFGYGFERIFAALRRQKP
jgi:hypothetical protein